MSEDIKRISIEEFCELGYLQEVNRQFLHPLGLALEATCEDDDETRPYKDARLTGVWDYRDDPEGMIFGTPYGKDPVKVTNVAAEKAKHWEARRNLFGPESEGVIEPLDWVYDGD